MQPPDKPFSPHSQPLYPQSPSQPFPPQQHSSSQQPAPQQFFASTAQPWQSAGPAPYPQTGQQPPQFATYPPHQAPAVNVNVSLPQAQGPGCLVRGLYYVFIGCWLGFLWLNLGLLLCTLIITLPLGLLMLNRLPQILTLRPPSVTTQANVSVVPGGVNINVTMQGAQQLPLLVRALYFIFVGWWAGWLWAYIGYVFCALIITLPLGLLMLNRLPTVLTLRRN